MKNSQQHLGNEANLATFSLSHDVIFLMVSPLLGRFLVSFNLQSVICGLQSAVWSLQSAVCSLQMSYTTLSRSTYTTVSTVKKWRLKENTVSSEMCSKCTKLGFAWNLDDSAQRYCKVNIRKFSRGVHTEITVFSKLKTERNVNQQGQNVTGPESKHLQLPDELRCELEHLLGSV